MKKDSSKILTLICFGTIVLSMFLPFYEGPKKGLIGEDSFIIEEIYYSQDFRLRMWVFNGFGSLFAIVNLVMAFVFVLSRFFFPKSLLTAILTTCVFVISLVLLMVSTSDKIQTAPLPDEMLYGFYLMLISQVILIAQSFTKAITEPPKDRRSNSDILDF
jgi:hypothetical protein